MHQLSDIAHAFVELIRTGQTSKLLIPVYVVVATVEFVISKAQGKRWTEGYFLSNAVSSTIAVFLNGLAAIVFSSLYLFIYNNSKFLNIEFGIVSFICVFMLYDLVYYLQHWLEHRTGMFWAFHSVHHSCNEMNVGISSRGLWGLSLTKLSYVVFPFLGVPFLMFVVIEVTTNLYGMLHHNRIVPRLGPLEHIFVTPANHRVHHGRESDYLDKNFGRVFILWDKLFGTHCLEGEEPTYGLVDRVVSKNPLVFQSHGLRKLCASVRSARRWSDKIRYLYKPPGWSHTGAHTTTDSLIVLQKAEA